MYGQESLWEISKGIFQISHKYLNHMNNIILYKVRSLKKF